MGLLKRIVGGAASEPIEAVGNVIGKVFEGKNAKLSHEEVMAELSLRPQLAQAEISRVQAQHRTVFVAGARPAILWVCAAGLAFVFVANPIIQWVTGSPGPQMPTEAMMSLVVSLLGLGGLRSLEKMAGKAK